MPMIIRTHFRRIIRLPRKMLWALLMEGVETRQMLRTYARYGRGKLLLSTKTKQPTPEELHQAREQLKDIPRFLPFFVIIIIPAPGVTEGYALLTITLEKWLGQRIRLLPSQFQGIFKKPKNPPDDDHPENIPE